MDQGGPPPDESSSRETLGRSPFETDTQTGVDSAVKTPPMGSEGLVVTSGFETHTQAGLLIPTLVMETPPMGRVRSSSAGHDPGSVTVQSETGSVIFGKYEILGQLGGGGMGDVWLVRDTGLDIKRALKMIKEVRATDPEALARFKREARAMARFNHPSAVAVHDSELDQHDIAYIVMEYVEGKSLEKVLAKGQPMPLDWTLRVLSQLCDVLELAHEKHGIIHRDLKPSNLMIVDGTEGREQLKVLDFGIAKMVGVGTSDQTQNFETTVAGLTGTPPYLSPEQAEGRADARSDLYSVGVILYEFLTGYRPFSGPTMRLIADTLHSDPPPFSKINPSARVPAAVERVVMRCLAKNPDQRPQTARALAEEFRAACPVVKPRRVGRLSRYLVTAALGVLLLVAGAVVSPFLVKLPEICRNADASGRFAEGGRVPMSPRSPPRTLTSRFLASGSMRAAARSSSGGRSSISPRGTSRSSPSLWRRTAGRGPWFDAPMESGLFESRGVRSRWGRSPARRTPSARTTDRHTK